MWRTLPTVSSIPSLDAAAVKVKLLAQCDVNTTIPRIRNNPCSAPMSMLGSASELVQIRQVVQESAISEFGTHVPGSLKVEMVPFLPDRVCEVVLVRHLWRIESDSDRQVSCKLESARASSLRKDHGKSVNGKVGRAER